jgi:hypothetical protein
MVVSARIDFLQQQLLLGFPVVVNFLPNAANHKLKVKVLVRPHTVPFSDQLAKPISMCLTSLQWLAESTCAVDRGHRHSDGTVEVCFWFSSRPDRSLDPGAAEFVPTSFEGVSNAGLDSTVAPEPLEGVGHAAALDATENVSEAAVTACDEDESIDPSRGVAEDEMSRVHTEIAANNRAFEEDMARLNDDINKKIEELRRRSGFVSAATYAAAADSDNTNSLHDLDDSCRCLAAGLAASGGRTVLAYARFGELVVEHLGEHFQHAAAIQSGPRMTWEEYNELYSGGCHGCTIWSSVCELYRGGSRDPRSCPKPFLDIMRRVRDIWRASG